jgi:hypothetical protein
VLGNSAFLRRSILRVSRSGAGKGSTDDLLVVDSLCQTNVLAETLPLIDGVPGRPEIVR